MSHDFQQVAAEMHAVVRPCQVHCRHWMDHPIEPEVRLKLPNMAVSSADFVSKHISIYVSQAHPTYYPLVMTNIAMENCHLQIIFSWKMVVSHSYLSHYQSIKGYILSLSSQATQRLICLHPPRRIGSHPVFTTERLTATPSCDVAAWSEVRNALISACREAATHHVFDFVAWPCNQRVSEVRLSFISVSSHRAQVQNMVWAKNGQHRIDHIWTLHLDIICIVDPYGTSKNQDCEDYTRHMTPGKPTRQTTCHKPLRKSV